jgi:mannose-1-phosphate guanylyltransferase
MLVAAGLGTRLDPLTRELPKAALPLANRPVAWFACDHLARSGIRDAVVNTHHLAERLRAQLEQHCPPGLSLRFVHEPRILGTGGGVRNAWQPADGEDLLVMNAKLVFAPCVARALQMHRESRAIATMVLRERPAGSGFAPVEVDGDGRVRRIRGGPGSPQPGLTPRIYTGVQLLSARAWRDLPADGDIIEHAYLAWLARGETVASVTEPAPWIDVGVTPRHYLEANLRLANGQVVWPGITPSPRGLMLAPGTRLGAGCDLQQVVLGEGAEAAPGAVLTRVVGWPGAHLKGHLEDTVVTTEGKIVRV